jgi:thiol-disulfide isomerase/thioredoxin
MKKILLLAGFVFSMTGANARALEVGGVAPCVTLDQIVMDGESGSHDVAGCILEKTNPDTQKFTVLEFMSTTCGACLESLAVFSKLSTEVVDQAQVRQVALDRNKERVRTHVSAYRELYKFPVALDWQRKAAEVYGIEFTPTWMIVDSKNLIRYKFVGIPDEQALLDIKNLLQSGQ